MRHTTGDDVGSARLSCGRGDMWAAEIALGDCVDGRGTEAG